MAELRVNQSIPTPRHRDELPRRLELPWPALPQEQASMASDGFCYGFSVNYLGDRNSFIKTRASRSYRKDGVHRDPRTEARDETEGTNGIESYFPNAPARTALERAPCACNRGG
ncbi:hypothetical protein VNO77_02529 [Canavalia gladiata]|uniref:Uncharacterized protein n=1 Tax=Canavalia gladiata TaxID=3824 RepID=A0AAN9R608_CANGL